MKTVFFVIGPEGCGTYMLAEALVSAGCTYCDQETMDGVREFIKGSESERFVLRRSIPHRGQMPIIQYLARSLEDDGHYVVLLAIVRELLPAMLSVQNRDPEKTFDHLRLNYGQALEIIAKNVMWTGAGVLSYEYFVLSKKYRKKVFSDYGLPEPEMEFYDGNAKYYE